MKLFFLVYVWQKNELKQLLGEDFKLFSEYYNINNYGFWEHDNYVLIKTQSDEEIASTYNISIESLKEKVASWKTILFEVREKRKTGACLDSSNYIMTYFTNALSENLKIFPVHRVIRNLTKKSIDKLRMDLPKYFHIMQVESKDKLYL